MAFCQYCGSQMNPDAKFCPSCGKSSDVQPNGFETNNSNTQNAGPSMADSLKSVVISACAKINDVINEQTSPDPEPNYDFDDDDDWVEEITKCPNCQSPVDIFSVNCPYCGTPIIRKHGSSACQQLTRKLNMIEDSRPKATLFNSVTTIIDMASQNLDSTDQKKVNLIRNFIVPNNKGDIIEFLLLAESNMKAHKPYLEAKDGFTRLVNQQMYKAWNAKYEEIMEKGRILLSNDPEFKLLYDRYFKDKNIKAGLCPYCGGKFKGAFKKVCASCGKAKDY